MTPTAGHQFDISPVHESLSVAGLTANCDMLRLVKGQPTPHLADFACVTVTYVVVDAEHLWLRCQLLPYGALVATPAVGNEENHFQSKDGSVNSCVSSAL